MSDVLGYTKGLQLLSADVLEWADSNGWTCMLLDNTYVFSAAHDFVNDVSGDEVVGTGYIAGGQVLTGMSISLVGGKYVFDCDNPSWATSTITARYAVFYKDTGTPATSPLLLVIDQEVDVSSAGTTFAVPINTAGLFALGYAA